MGRRSNLFFMAVLACTSLSSQAQGQTAPLESQSFRIGTEGALCEAQGIRLGGARNSYFDRKWALICSDVDRPVGAAYSWRGSVDGLALADRARAERLTCGSATAAQGLSGAATVRTCRDPQSGLDWHSYQARAGGWVHVVEGLASFDSALRLALANLVEDRVVPGTVEIVSTGGSGSLAEARASLGDSNLLIGQGYWRNNAGEFVEAEEYFRADLLDGEAGASPEAEVQLAAERHEFLVNRALQLSNLGRFDEAARIFAEATDLASRDPIQARLLRNFEAIDALNRGRLGDARAIIARPVPALSAPVAAEAGAVAIDPAIAASLNAGLGASLTDAVAQESRLTTVERATILDAQARQIAGSILRLTGEPGGALTELAAAREAMLGVKQGRVLSVARLEAQVLSEMALAQEQLGRFGEAEELLREGLALTEARYPGTASVGGARARLAAFLVRRGQDAQAMELYRMVVAEATGRRTPLVGLEHQLRPYFELLVAQSPENPALVEDLFLASQLIERPGAAQALSQLARRLAAGDGEASELFRRATSVERELNRTNLAIAQVRAREEGAPPAELAELDQRRARLEAMQLELVDALAAYPAYRSVTHSYVAADEVVASLKPGEAYLKLVQLGDAMFAVYLSPENSVGWRVDADARQIAALVTRLRESISLTLGGVTATYPFDVDSSHKLYQALFAPVGDRLARLDHLVFEPDGALLQLPINLLIADQAGVDAYHRRVEAGADEFDFRGIAWLGRDKAISTALSPASFRDARTVAESSATQAFLGFGQNSPVGELTRSSLLQQVSSGADPGCEYPLETWNRPINAGELLLASQVIGPDRSAVITGDAFTDTAIEQREDLADYRIVHFATHGLVTAPRPGCPARPALVTSFGGPASDGLLSFGDVFDLALDADLVILSACNTASLAGLDVTREAGVEGGGGQALDGLVRAFIAAGGRQVIASHWPAPDDFDATERLFRGFFESGTGATIAGALLAAQHQLMDDPETSHPFYWSGFAVIGDGQRALFSGT